MDDVDADSRPLMPAKLSLSRVASRHMKPQAKCSKDNSINEIG